MYSSSARLLGRAPLAIPQAATERFSRRLQIDHHVRRRQVTHQELEQPLVDEELVVIQVDERVDPITFEDVVADGRVVEEIALAQSPS